MNQDDFLAGEHPQFERMGAIERAMGQGLFENPMFQEAVSDVACFMTGLREPKRGRGAGAGRTMVAIER